MNPENEAKVIEIFLGDYINVRLYHMFLVEVGKPFIAFIDFFERREVNAHLIFPKMVLLLNQHLSSFLRDGKDRESGSAKDLLMVDFRDKEKFLNEKDIFVGTKARNFISFIGLNPSSPELNDFFNGVIR